MELQTNVHSTLAECFLGDLTLTSICHSCYGNISMTSLLQQHSRQCMPCSAKFSMILQTEILSLETLDFLKQIIFLKSFNSVL